MSRRLISQDQVTAYFRKLTGIESRPVCDAVRSSPIAASGTLFNQRAVMVSADSQTDALLFRVLHYINNKTYITQQLDFIANVVIFFCDFAKRLIKSAS